MANDENNVINDDENFEFNNMSDAGESELLGGAKNEGKQAKEESIEKIEALVRGSNAAYSIKSFYNRARRLSNEQIFNFAHLKGVGDGLFVPDPKSDLNRDHFFDVLFDYGSGRVPFPYFDLFRARLINHLGEPVSEFSSVAKEMCGAMDAVNLKKQTFNSIDESYRRWASDHKLNSLIDRMNDHTPDWDGQHRLDDYMVNLFRLQDSELNRLVCRYFWLSLYNRIMTPGCNAPLSIALIGAQDVGKSYFSVLLCQILMGDPNATPCNLSLNDIERNPKDWLRRMTGNSIIANIGEMKGFRKTDINTIKDFATRTVDGVDQKFQSVIDTPRQWVMVMDGNSYEGFQRDETGNRRFYPMFVNQVEDEDGQPKWATDDNWKADFTDFESELWQIMAECRAFMEAQGNKGYQKLVGDVSREVSRFSKEEMETGRGIIRDEITETALRNIVLAANFVVSDRRAGAGVFLPNTELSRLWNKHEKGTINFASVKRILTSLKFEQIMLKGLGRGYLLRDVMDINKAKKQFWLGEPLSDLISENPNEDANFEKDLNDARSKYNDDGGF